MRWSVMSFFLSVILTFGYNQPVVMASCCPMITVMTIRVVPMLVVPMPARQDTTQLRRV